MSGLDWREEALTKSHDRKSFDCGDPALNRFIAEYARQMHDRGVAKTYVAVAPSGEILGYYAVSPAGLDVSVLDQDMRRRFGQHEMPLFRMGRLAVSVRSQGTGLGSELFMLAVARSQLPARSLGGVGLLIEAKSDRAAAWYQRIGAAPSTAQPRTLIYLFR